jgi:hypothetical protein
MLFLQNVEGVTLKPRFMVSAWLRDGVAGAIMSKMRRDWRASAASCAPRVSSSLLA